MVQTKGESNMVAREIRNATRTRPHFGEAERQERREVLQNSTLPPHKAERRAEQEGEETPKKSKGKGQETGEVQHGRGQYQGRRYHRVGTIHGSRAGRSMHQLQSKMGQGPTGDQDTHSQLRQSRRHIRGGERCQGATRGGNGQGHGRNDRL